MGATAGLPHQQISDRLTDLAYGGSVDLVDPSLVDAAGVPVDVHTPSIGRSPPIGARRTATLVSTRPQVLSPRPGRPRGVKDELMFPALRTQPAATTTSGSGNASRQPLDLLLVGLPAWSLPNRYVDAKAQVLMPLFGQDARDAEALLVPELHRLLDESEGSLAGWWSGSSNLRGRPRPGLEPHERCAAAHRSGGQQPSQRDSNRQDGNESGG